MSNEKWTKVSSEKILSGLMIAIFLAGCGDPQRIAKIDPTLLPELRGHIRPDKKLYEIGEPIAVKYWLTNVTDKVFSQELEDGSKDRDKPFQGYLFNAVDIEQKTRHLELTKASLPIQGLLTINPGKKKIFVENVFLAKAPGTYHLTMELRWASGKKVAFSPVIIGVQAPPAQAPKIAAKLQQALDDLGTAKNARARETILDYGSEAAPLLIDILGDKDENLASEAFYLLSKIAEDDIDEQDVMKACANALNPARDAYREKKKTRERIVELLKNLLENSGKFSTCGPLCITVCKDPNLEIRLIALKIIDETFANNVVIPLAILLLADDKLEIRMRAWEVIHSRTRERLEFTADGQVEERRKQINDLRAWWHEKDPKAIAKIEKMLKQ